MAAIGDQLLQAEPGYRRYDDLDSRILHIGTWYTNTHASQYNGSVLYAKTIDNTIHFKFYGTKLRIIAAYNTGQSNQVQVTVDGVSKVHSCLGSLVFCVLVEEFTNLNLGVHDVTIKALTSGDWQADAIDIDEDGYLVHPILNQVSSTAEAQVGDCIPIRYTALTSGIVGYFSELGTCSASEIPVTGTATPDGLVYLIMVGYDYLGRKMFIPDRNLQTNISCDTLNNTGICSGENLSKLSINPIIESSSFSVVFDNNTATGGNISLNNPFTFFFKGKVKLTSFLWFRNVNVPNGAVIHSFEVLGSNDNEKYEIISIENNISLINNSYNLFNINNPNFYKYYKIIFTESGGFSYITANEIILYGISLGFTEKDVVRLLTGGISPTDTDNEWDKIVVNSTLNGTITAGDNNIWHWNGIYSLTSTTNVVGATYRTVRGGTSVSNNIYLATSIVGGFRPVILVESDGGSNKFLIKQGDNYYSLKSEFYINNQLVPITLINGESPNDDDFKNNGFDDINDLIKKINTEENNKPIDQFGEIKRTSVSFTTTDNKIFIVDPLTNVPFKQNSVICYKDGIEAIPDEINYDEGIVVFNTEQIGIMTFDYTYIVPFDILLYKPNN